MAVETAARTEPEPAPGEGAPARRRWGVGDYLFLVLFIAYTAGSLVVLAQGLGAVWAHLSKPLHASLHLRGLGTGPTARAALRMANESHVLPPPATVALGYAFSF